MTPTLLLTIHYYTQLIKLYFIILKTIICVLKLCVSIYVFLCISIDEIFINLKSSFLYLIFI